MIFRGKPKGTSSCSAAGRWYATNRRRGHHAVLADSVPDRQLLAPTSSLSRYKTLEWLNYIATELHKGFTPLFRPDTPEEYKPTVRALLEKKCSM